MIDSGYDSGIIEDDKHNPIEIKDLNVLLQELSSAYHSAMNEYLIENKKINKARALKTTMDW